MHLGTHDYERNRQPVVANNYMKKRHGNTGCCKILKDALKDMEHEFFAGQPTVPPKFKTCKGQSVHRFWIL